MPRLIQDALLTANVALPNAANTVNTNGIDLGAVTPYPVTEKLGVQVLTSVATGANSKNINVSLQDSADNSSFAAISTLGTVVTTGNATNHIASTSNYVLPPGVRRHVRATATGEANGGDSSDGTLTIKILT